MIARIRPYVITAILAHLALAGVAMAGISFDTGTGPTFPEPPTVAQPTPCDRGFVWGDLIDHGCDDATIESAHPDDKWFQWAL